MGILDVKELTAGAMKSGVKMEHASDRLLRLAEGWHFWCLYNQGIYFVWNGVVLQILGTDWALVGLLNYWRYW